MLMGERCRLIPVMELMPCRVRTIELITAQRMPMTGRSLGEGHKNLNNFNWMLK